MALSLCTPIRCTPLHLVQVPGEMARRTFALYCLPVWTMPSPFCRRACCLERRWVSVFSHYSRALSPLARGNYT